MPALAGGAGDARAQPHLLDADVAPAKKLHRPPGPDRRRPGREARRSAEQHRAVEAQTAVDEPRAPASPWPRGCLSSGASARQRIDELVHAPQSSLTSTRVAREHRVALQQLHAVEVHLGEVAMPSRRSSTSSPRPAADASNLVRNHQSSASKSYRLAARRHCPASSSTFAAVPGTARAATRAPPAPAGSRWASRLGSAPPPSRRRARSRSMGIDVHARAAARRLERRSRSLER